MLRYYYMLLEVHCSNFNHKWREKLSCETLCKWRGEVNILTKYFILCKWGQLWEDNQIRFVKITYTSYWFTWRSLLLVRGTRLNIGKDSGSVDIVSYLMDRWYMDLVFGWDGLYTQKVVGFLTHTWRVSILVSVLNRL